MSPTESNSSFVALRRFVRERATAPVEQCDFCSAALADEHEHLIEPATRQFVCACQPCAILFGSQGGTKYRRVPRRVSLLTDFRLTDAEWESLMIPIGLAFFFRSSAGQQIVALFPSPGGPTEALPDPAAWREIEERNPALQTMQPDVEALLVNRIGSAREYFIAPIDECFRLTGLIRARWRGLSGGTGMWREIERFLVELRRRCGQTAGSR
ncbi:MAG TPA: DUF5947 family protein [Blastocatellia bacterium]|nr:DUF5947 family protein [Blastocatellia bacterium]